MQIRPTLVRLVKLNVGLSMFLDHSFHLRLSLRLPVSGNFGLGPKFRLSERLNDITLLFDLRPVLERTWAQRKAQLKAKSPAVDARDGWPHITSTLSAEILIMLLALAYTRSTSSLTTGRGLSNVSITVTGGLSRISTTWSGVSSSGSSVIIVGLSCVSTTRPSDCWPVVLRLALSHGRPFSISVDNINTLIWFSKVNCSTCQAVPFQNKNAQEKKKQNSRRLRSPINSHFRLFGFFKK